MKRSYLFWGIVLIMFGSIFILDGIYLLPGTPLEYLWQVFLIILGTWILLNSRWKLKREEQEYSSVALQNATHSKISINHGAGHLKINSGAKKGELLAYASMDTIQDYVHVVGDFLEVRLSPASNIGPLIGFAEGFNWDLLLTNEIPIELNLETGASQSQINLIDLNIPELKLSTGASTNKIILPAISKQSVVTINAGMASLDIQIPTGVSARIHVKDGLTSLTIDKERFAQIESHTYQSHDYEQGTNRTDIKIEAGVGTITIH